jgi:hypothetical protein
VSFEILDRGSPKFVEGYPETFCSDGEPDLIEWEIYCIRGTRELEAKPGEVIIWRDEFQHPTEAHRKVLVICEFQVEYIGSEGNLYGWGVAEWSDGIPLQRPFGRRPDVYLD